MKKDGQKKYRIRKLNEKLEKQVAFRKKMNPGLNPGQKQSCIDTEDYLTGQIDSLKGKEATQPKNERYMLGFGFSEKWVKED